MFRLAGCRYVIKALEPPFPRLIAWHGRHEGDGDRNHRPGKGENSEAEHPVSKDKVEQSKDIQPRVEFDRSKEAPPSGGGREAESADV